MSETRAVTLFKRLKRLLSLLLQLAILAALILAVARPSFGLGGDKQKHVVLLLDASASMGAVEEGANGASIYCWQRRGSSSSRAAPRTIGWWRPPPTASTS